MNFKGKNNSNFGNKWTEKQKKRQSILTKKAMTLEIKEKMKRNHADVSGKNNPMFGVHRFGKNSPGFKDGRTIIKHYCIDCGKEINWQSLRCRECADKARRKPQNYCIDCGKKISINAKRCRSCAIKNYIRDNPRPTGENHPNFIHGQGYSPYPIEFNDALKAKIRKRDNYTCQNCNITEEEHIIVFGQKLSIHHIDYNKNNCEEDNLIAVCYNCNIRANFNREYWRKYFKSRIYHG